MEAQIRVGKILDTIFEGRVVSYQESLPSAEAGIGASQSCALT